jgi:hypothetical protein
MMINTSRIRFVSVVGWSKKYIDTIVAIKTKITKITIPAMICRCCFSCSLVISGGRDGGCSSGWGGWDVVGALVCSILGPLYHYKNAIMPQEIRVLGESPKCDSLPPEEKDGVCEWDVVPLTYPQPPFVGMHLLGRGKCRYPVRVFRNSYDLQSMWWCFCTLAKHHHIHLTQKRFPESQRISECVYWHPNTSNY